MKMFSDCLKDATARSTHVVTSLGSENFRFGRSRSQPMRDKKRRASDKLTASLSAVTEAKWPDVGLDEVEEGDIVRQSKKFKPWELPLLIKKVDPDQHLIFGWASVVEKDGKVIIDKQGDIIPVAELEEAAYEFTLHSRGGGDMHDRQGLAKLIESMVFTKDKQKVLGIDLGQIGWWVGFKVHDKELWAAHKRGDRPEFSIGGAAIPIDVDDL
jgi:hypothetical protein